MFSQIFVHQRRSLNIFFLLLSCRLFLVFLGFNGEDSGEEIVMTGDVCSFLLMPFTCSFFGRGYSYLGCVTDAVYMVFGRGYSYVVCVADCLYFLHAVCVVWYWLGIACLYSLYF